MENKKENYLFLYLNTGGGHLAPARVIAQAICEKRSNIEIILADGLGESRRIFKYIIEDGYKNVQGSKKFVFEALYFLNKCKFVAFGSLKLTSLMTQSYIRKLVVEKNPDKIVIFHFFLINPVLEVLKQLKINIPITVVVTDPYSAPRIWFLNKNVDYVVFSDRVKNYAMSKRISSERVKVFPFPINKKFSVAAPFERLKEVRDKIGIDENKKTILVIGGGEGMAKGDIIAKKLAEAISDIQIIVVCARNKRLFNKVCKLTKVYNNIFPLGFVDYVHELVNLSSAVVTKCGASTFMEVLLTKKLILINNYIWGQEKGNVEFVVDNNLGIYEENIDKLVAVVKKILKDEKYYDSFINNIKKMNLENGTDKVADHIILSANR